jgi:two-component system uhpT operon response regulator UhpA
MTQILIVDRQEHSRDTLRRLLGTVGEIAVPVTSDGYETSVAAVCRHEIDIVLLDLAGSDDAMQTLADLKQIRPRIRTLVLADSIAPEIALEFLEAGVDGYVARADGATALIAAIRSVAAGGRYVCPDAGWRIAMSLLQAYPGTVLH